MRHHGAQLAGDGSSDGASLDIVFNPINACGSRGKLFFEWDDFALNTIQPCLPISLTRLLLWFQAADTQLEALGRRPAPLRLGLSLQEIALRDQPLRLQTRQPFSFLLGKLRQRLSFSILGVRLFRSYPSGLQLLLLACAAVAISCRSAAI